MEANITPSSRAGGAHGRVSHQGRLYRFRKPLSGGQFRWTGSRPGRNFSCPRYAVTDGASQGCRVVRAGGHAGRCEPSASAAAVAPIRADVIAREGAFGATQPLRTVALSIAGASDPATHMLPNAAQLKRSAQNAAARKRKRTQAEGETGLIANYNNLDDMSIPESVTRRPDGESFRLHDSGPGGDRILLFGTQSNIQSLSNAEVWGADGAFKVRPAVWAQLYTVHAVVGGYFLPCVYALLPSKSEEAYSRMWGAIKDLIGEEDDKDRVCTMDFEKASINAIHRASPQTSIAGCIFHLGQSICRKVQELGLSAKYRADEDFRLRVKTLSAICPPPH